MAARVDAAIDEVRRDEAAMGSSACSGASERLAPTLGLDPDKAQAIYRAFDRRGELERRAFIRLVLDGESIDRIAHDEAVSASEVGRRARRVLGAILDATQIDPAPSRAPENGHE